MAQNNEVYLACGCLSNAIDQDNNPACSTHDGLMDTSPAELPDLMDRKAVCTQHKFTPKKVVDSVITLPFFQYRPDMQFDSYYCGCWGWD